MKKTRKIRLLAFILTLCMTIGVLPLCVLADGTETELPEQITETTNENLTAFQLGLGEKSVAELENMTLSAADIPASISRETVEAKDHVLRLREQEADLNTVIFQNRDGGKTVYLFGSPVKYVDANGNIRDKSTTLVSENVTVNGKTYAHSATDNFFGQYYPTMPQNGVMLAFGQYTVEMKPVITGVLTLRDTVVSDNKVTYNKVFGTGTSLVYTPTLNGVKEDIILSAYTGKSSFSFTLKTNGLAIVQDENDTFLADFEGNKVASLGDVIITDKVGKTTYGTMTVVTKIEREEYTVTVNAPTAFLTSSTTVYPVTVDPSFVINEQETVTAPDGDIPVNAIEDLCIYNGSTNPYNSGVADIGSYYYDEESGEEPYVARMLYRINQDYFETSNMDAMLSLFDFVDARLYIPVYINSSDVTVAFNPCVQDCFEGEEGEVCNDYKYCSSFPEYISEYEDNTGVDNSDLGIVEFNVSSIFKYWKENPETYSQGMIMRIIDDSTDMECNTLSVYNAERIDYNIYMTIELFSIYNSENYIYSNTTHQLMTIQSSLQGYCLDTNTYYGNDYQKWTIEKYDTGKSYFRSNLVSSNGNNYTIAVIDDELHVVELPLVLTDNYLWEITYVYGCRAFVIENIASSHFLVLDEKQDLSTTYKSSYLWRFQKTSQYINLSSFTITYDDWISINQTINCTLVLNPVNPTYGQLTDFKWESSDPNVIYVNDSGKITAISNGYATITVTHKMTGIVRKETVVAGQLLSAEEYKVMNVGSSKYIDIEGPSVNDGAYIQQWESHEGSQEKWIFEYCGIGYYRIKSLLSNKYISTYNTQDNSSIIQTQVDSALCKWRVLVTDDGNYRFICKASGVNLVLSLPYLTTQNGVNLCLKEYSNDSDFSDEWIIQKDYDVSLIAIPENYDRTSFFDDVTTNLNSMGYSNIYAKQTCMNHNFIINHMMNSKITVIRTHGAPTVIQTSNKFVSVDMLSSLPADIFINSDLIIYGACQTAQPIPDMNLVDATYCKGARTVIGFEDPVYSNACNDWIKYFFYYYEEYYQDDSKSFVDVCEKTDESMQSHSHYNVVVEGILKGSVEKYVIVGNRSFP